MTVLPPWRRWAVKLMQHAAWVLSGARSPWAEAMQCELDYIEDDWVALQWALGCIVAGYKARLATWSSGIWPDVIWPGVGARNILRHAAASGALMLIIGFALLGHAESQPEPPQPVLDETCGTPDAAPDIGQTSASSTGSVSRETGNLARMPHPAPETGCADRNALVPALPKHQTR